MGLEASVLQVPFSNSVKSMLKYLLLPIGIIFIIISLMPLFTYGWDYTILSTYGQGYVWGKVLYLLIGLGLCFYSIRKIMLQVVSE